MCVCCACVWVGLYQDYVKAMFIDVVTDPWIVLLQCLQIPAEANKPQLVSLFVRLQHLLKLNCLFLECLIIG